MLSQKVAAKDIWKLEILKILKVKILIDIMRSWRFASKDTNLQKVLWSWQSTKIVLSDILKTENLPHISEITGILKAHQPLRTNLFAINYFKI